MLPLLLATAFAHELRVEMLDVGQGDGIVIRAEDKVVLIDAGDAPDDVAKQLTAMGITQISLVVATHPHADHIGGMLRVVETFPIKVYVDNHQAHTTATYQNLVAAIKAKDIAWLTPGTGDDEVAGFNIGPDARLTLLFPLDGERITGSRSDLNANSVIARLDHGQDCFLFVGDSEADTERRLLNNGLAQCDVLKVAHHGSEYASTQGFLQAVQPKIALVSVGADNRYGHPGPNTMERLYGVGAQVYRTDLHGRITVLSTGAGVKVTTEKAADGALMADVTPRAAPSVRAPTGVRPVAPMATRTAEPDMAAEPEPGMAEAPASTAATPTAATAAPPAAQEVCPFPASRSSEVFHEDGCGNAEKISPTNYVCYPTREAAIAAGKRPAGCCKP